MIPTTSNTLRPERGNLRRRRLAAFGLIAQTKSAAIADSAAPTADKQAQLAAIWLSLLISDDAFNIAMSQSVFEASLSSGSIPPGRVAQGGVVGTVLDRYQ
jgi:hypothetical protein